MNIATGKKKQSRGGSIVLMLLTIAIISFVLYRAAQSVTGTAAAEPGTQVVRSQACGVADIAVDKLRDQGIHVTGRLLNNCALAVGAQLKVTTYDKAGNILSVDDIWPASISNIPAHSVFPFEWQLTSARGVSTFTVDVTRVKTW
jgi:hypothetical protein